MVLQMMSAAKLQFTPKLLHFKHVAQGQPMTPTWTEITRDVQLGTYNMSLQ